MWFLIPKEAPDDRLHLPVGKQLLVGRSQGHVTIDDASVSRKHAVITVNKTSENGTTKFRVVLRDCSKFGSFVNEEKLVNQERELSDEDSVCFGVPTGIQFSVRREPLVVCCSSISSSVRAEVNRKLQYLGGEMVNEWSRRCTLLLMTKVSITIKVISALIQGSDVVTPNYLFHLGDFFEGKRPDRPHPSEYQPSVTQDSQHLENMSVDLQPRPNRRSLFTGDTFIFLTEKRFKRLTAPLQLGGARCLLWETEEDSRHQGGEAVIASSLVFYEDEPTAWHRRVYELLKRNRRRPIMDSEIGYAVLACSKEDYCNVTKKCDQLVGRHDVSSLSHTQNPFEISSQAPSQLDLSHSRMMETTQEASGFDSTQLQSECLLANPQAISDTFTDEVKREPDSAPSLHPDILVPQTPPDSTHEHEPDVTSVTHVACSLEPKQEELSEDEDPFDAIAPRKRPHTPTQLLASADTTVQARPSPVKARRASSPAPEPAPPAQPARQASPEPDNLPRNCGSVKVVSLLRRRPTVATQRRHAGPNFKRFRKVHLAPASRRPPLLTASSRADLASHDAEDDAAASQAERNALDSEADRLFEEMRHVAPRRRR